LKATEAKLLAQQPLDWRDVEALAQIDSPAARAAVLAATTGANVDVRREAMRNVPADAIDPAVREAQLLADLQGNDVFGGLSQAIDEAAEFHPPAVVSALLHAVLHQPGQKAILFAALLYYIHGKADTPFDWDQRPFFLRFAGDTRTGHEAAFRELCANVGIDSAELGLRC
jgi:hypothetical protein